MLERFANLIPRSVVTSGILALACYGLLGLQAPAQRSASPRFASSPELASALAEMVTELGGQDSSQAPPATEAATKAAGLPFKWKKKSVGSGNYSSIAIDPDGNPHVVYSRFTGDDFVLMHAWANGSHWFSEVIDDTSEVFDNSVAIDANGGLHVAYKTGDALGPLKYAYNAGDGWQTEVVDSGGYSNSIAIDDEGFAHIVHVGGLDSAVRYAKQTASGWDLEVIPDTSGLYFGGTSLRLHDGKVYATFCNDVAAKALDLAIRDSDIWSVQEIDPDGFTGSMDFDQDGVLHVVYQREQAIELRHAWLDGLDWQSEVLVTHTTLMGEPFPDGIGALAEQPALVEDSSGRLQLVFGLDLVKGNKEGQGLLGMYLSEGVWFPTLVAPKLGGNNSIALSPDGLVHVSTRKPKGGDGPGTIVALQLKGAKLSLSVAPKESGTISVSPSGLECTGKAVESDFPGTELMLTATPATGFSFVKWSPASLGTDLQVSVTLDHGHKVTAHFAKTLD